MNLKFRLLALITIGIAIAACQTGPRTVYLPAMYFKEIGDVAPRFQNSIAIGDVQVGEEFDVQSLRKGLINGLRAGGLNADTDEAAAFLLDMSLKSLTFSEKDDEIFARGEVAYKLRAKDDNRIVFEEVVTQEKSRLNPTAPSLKAGEVVLLVAFVALGAVPHGSGDDDTEKVRLSLAEDIFADSFNTFVEHFKR